MEELTWNDPTHVYKKSSHPGGWYMTNSVLLEIVRIDVSQFKPRWSTHIVGNVWIDRSHNHTEQGIVNHQ